MTQYPRDGDDELRPRGRDAGERPAPRTIDIQVNGVVFGTVDPATLKAKAQFALEDVRGAYDLLDWLHTYAGVPEDALPQIRDELGEMTVQAIVDLAQEISTAIGEAMALPKTKRPTWRSR